MNFEQADLIFELEVLKGKLDDLYTSNSWLGDEVFNCGSEGLKTAQDKAMYLGRYDESRIHHEQTSDLMYMYLKTFDELLKQFKELNKKTSSDSDSLATISDNA